MEKCNRYFKKWLKEESVELYTKWKSQEKKMFQQCKKKKLPTSFLFYCIEKRNLVRNENPDLIPSEITSFLANDWRKHKNANDEVYQYYCNMYKNALNRSKIQEIFENRYPHLEKKDIDYLVNKKLSSNAQL